MVNKFILTINFELVAPRRVLICDPELVKEVTVTDCQKYERTDLAKLIFPNIGNSLFGSKGKDHARQRKMLGPAFHYSNLKGMVSVFEEDVLNLIKVEKWAASQQQIYLKIVPDNFSFCGLQFSLTLQFFLFFLSVVSNITLQ